MTWILQSRIWLVLGIVIPTTAGRAEPQAGGQAPRHELRSRNHRNVTGPSEPINRAIAAGATATVTLQPVQPKTLPASSYPPGSSIVGQTLTLGSVPARVWIEVHVTGWNTEFLRTAQVTIDATDIDGDGGGYFGAAADCGGNPSNGGDLAPAMQPCNVNADCRATMSGISAPCADGEPSRCVVWNGLSPGDYFPPGRFCEPGFQDKCDPEWIGNANIVLHGAVDQSSLNFRYGMTTDAGENTPDFAPSLLGTLVLDVPSNARGTYQIDLDQNQVFLCEFPCPDGLIPIGELNYGGIKFFDCISVMDCQDNNVCTVDACVDSCYCTNTPVAGWNPATECCDPMSGVQSPIPLSSPCRIGGCSNGGSSGSPTYTNVPDGTSCISQDQCDLQGQCANGSCDSQEYAGSNCPKSRFISFDVGSLNEPMAYRVRFVSLHHPVPPYSGGLASDFSAFEGEYRWVGDATSYVESTTNPAEVYSAELVCDPFYRDWSGIDLLHVTGSAVVPSSVYEVQSIIQGLDINEESNYSAPITVVTSRWSDVVYPYNPPSTTVQPDATDITALADKFRSLVGSISKPRALLAGAGMTDIPGLTLDVNFAEISACLDAFRGRPYPYGGPTPCP